MGGGDRLRRPIGALIVAALAMMAAAPPPRPPPSVYMTPNHGLLMRVPPRLSYCPLPDGWMGTDHGTKSLSQAACACDAPEAPHISVHYELNVAEMTRADGTERHRGPRQTWHGWTAAAASPSCATFAYSASPPSPARARHTGSGTWRRCTASRRGRPA